MKIVLNILCLITLLASHIQSQQFSTGSPEWLVDMFFNKSEFPDKANYFSGEMLNAIDEPTIGEELNDEREFLFHQIKSENNRIVFAVELMQNETIIDFYCYLVKQGEQWKINSIRRFLLPEFIYTVYDSLTELKSLSPKDSTFYLSLKLFTINDAGLKEYLLNNKQKFEQLVNHFRQELGEEIGKSLASLGCKSIYLDRKYPGSLFIQILIFENMESGFIFTEHSTSLPGISELNYIYLEEVLEGWYIFRRI